MTRMVYFASVPEEIRERYKKTAYIFACMQCMMKEGLSYREYFRKYRNFTGRQDGTASAETPPGRTHRLRLPGIHSRPGYGRQMFCGEAFAWNPTIEGTKCEETTYLTADGVETFTRTKEWPSHVVETPYGDYEVADHPIIGDGGFPEIPRPQLSFSTKNPRRLSTFGG